MWDCLFDETWSLACCPFLAQVYICNKHNVCQLLSVEVYSSITLLAVTAYIVNAWLHHYSKCLHMTLYKQPQTRTSGEEQSARHSADTSELFCKHAWLALAWFLATDQPDGTIVTADPSDLFLPDLSSDTSDSKPSVSAISTAQLSSGSTPVPAAKKLRRSNTKDSSTATTATASITHRPPLAIRPAPSGFSMMQQPMVGVTGAMGGGQWGYQHMPGYVWGTPTGIGLLPLDRSSSWQVGVATYIMYYIVYYVSCNNVAYVHL